MGVAWEDQGTPMVEHHMDGEDQKALVVQDSLLVVLELLFDRTLFLTQLLGCVAAAYS